MINELIDDDSIILHSKLFKDGYLDELENKMQLGPIQVGMHLRALPASLREDGLKIITQNLLWNFNCKKRRLNL